MYWVLQVVATLAIASICWYFFPRLVSSTRLGGWVSDDYQAVVVSLGQWLIVLVAAVAFFAYWSVLSNGLCSLLLYLFQPFRIGDWIEMRENENNIVAAGKVTGINLIYVTLAYEDADGVDNEFQIPTNLMFQRTIRVIRGEETKSLGQHYAEHHGRPAVAAPNPKDGENVAQ